MAGRLKCPTDRRWHGVSPRHKLVRHPQIGDVQLPEHVVEEGREDLQSHASGADIGNRESPVLVGAGDRVPQLDGEVRGGDVRIDQGHVLAIFHNFDGGTGESAGRLAAPFDQDRVIRRRVFEQVAMGQDVGPFLGRGNQRGAQDQAAVERIRARRLRCDGLSRRSRAVATTIEQPEHSDNDQKSK